MLHGAGSKRGLCLRFPRLPWLCGASSCRFMGDLPEPVLFTRSILHGSSVMGQIHDALGKDSSSQPPQHSRSAQVRHEGGAKGRHSRRPQAQGLEKLDQKGAQCGVSITRSTHGPLGFSILNCTFRELMSQALYPGLCRLYSHWGRSFGR